MITETPEQGPLPTGRAVKQPKLLTSEALRLDLTSLKPLGFPTAPVMWTVTWGDQRVLLGRVREDGGLENVAIVRWPPEAPLEIDQLVPLQSTPCHFGGRRWWFQCPLALDDSCVGRCRILYRPVGARRWGCRECHELTYPVRKFSRQARFEGWTQSLALLREEAERPSWMLWRPGELDRRARRWRRAARYQKVWLRKFA